MFLASLVAVCALVLVHIFTHRLKFLDGTPRSRWLSAAGGISLAYVFLHLMPELAEGQAILSEDGGGLDLIEFEIYGLALIGLVGYYGLERMVQCHTELGRAEMPGDTSHEGASAHDDEAARRDDADTDTREHPPFWVHLASFALYNVITGYLLLHQGGATGHDGGAEETGATAHGAEAGVADEGGMATLLTFAIAMALHFLVTDYGLREDFRRGWMKTGRWVLSASVVVGWAIGLAVELPEIVILGAIALLGGGVILNVLKEELPEERQSRFGALVAGAAGYAALLAFAR